MRKINKESLAGQVLPDSQDRSRLAQKQPSTAGTGPAASRPFDAGLLSVAAVMLLLAAIVEAMIKNPDVLNYQCYATAFWYGAKTSQLLPVAQCQFLQLSQFHTLPLEYPPLTLVFFSIPLLLPKVSYPFAFALCMAAAAFFIHWLLSRYGLRRSGRVFVVYLLAGCLATAFARYDILPAALTLLCLILAEGRRWKLAYAVLALGVLTKLYPLLLFPVLFLAEQRDQPGFYSPDLPLTLKTIPAVLRRSLRNLRSWRWKNSLVFFGTLIGVTAIFGLFNFKGAVLEPLAYYFLRPPELETTEASLLWLVSKLGTPIAWELSFGSLNAVSPLAGGLAQAAVILFYLGYIYTILQQWRGKLDLVQAALAVLFVLLATGKVFSPQYLIWLIPLLAYSGASNPRWWFFWGGISLLTTLIYPVCIGLLRSTTNVPSVPALMPAVLLRDGLFVLIALAYLFNFLNLRQHLARPEQARESQEA